MSNQGLIKHTAQPSAQGRLVASTSVLAIRGALAAAPAGAGEGADTRLASSAAGGLFPITQRLEEEASNPPALGDSRRSRGYRGHLHCQAQRPSECQDKGTNVCTEPGQGAVR